MLRRPPRLASLLVILSLAGCQEFNLRSQNPDDDEMTAAKTAFIGDQVTVSGLHPILVETVSLVTGLDNTGGDTPPSMYRTMLLSEMRKRNVVDPNTILRSPETALVVVRANIPPVIRVGDPFDVEVVLPESTQATSLKGGRLMECHLAEQALVPGRGSVKGHALGVAEGPVMLSTGEVEKSSLAGVLKRGRLLGGAKYKGGILKKDRQLGLYVRNDLRSVRQTRRIAEAIGRRFHDFDHGIKRPLSKAVTDQYIELQVHPRYKENYIRYVQVVRSIPLNESTVEQRERMERLRKSLLSPETASRSATELEAIGSESILILKEGLASPDPEVQFYAADALAYLGDKSGARVLADAARNQEAFRVYAFAALATLGDDALVTDLLKELITEPSIDEQNGVRKELWSAETRYGAFHTLLTVDKFHPLIHPEKMNGDEFNLHAIKTAGEPLVHLTTHRVPQVVVFGAEQTLRTPVNLSAGRHIVITAPAGSDTVTISRFQAGRDDHQVTCTTQVADVIRALAEVDASYPDVAQMLVQAERQENLRGRLELDALPRPGRYYHRPKSPAAADDSSVARREKTRIGRPNMMPNLFPAPDRVEKGAGSAEPDDEKTTDRRSGDAGEASLADARDAPEADGDDKGGFFKMFRRQ
ncbi:MAG: flagellar basal body P-ring protein FlgI [Planctomycetaceae bacterium]